MTIKEFLDHIKRIHRGSHFFWDSFGDLRQAKTGRCPITAVCYNLTGEMVDNGEYEYAGKKIGLKSRNIENIVDAADSTGNPKLNKKLHSIVK